jgi:choline dehydrogenase-like flavoprotein
LNASREGSLPIKAIGVEFSHTAANEQRSRVYFGKEVVLAAGAIGSPKVLELSGVGNSTYVQIPPLPFFVLRAIA